VCVRVLQTAAVNGGGGGSRILPAAHMRDLVLRLLQQNMTLADKLKKSLQRRRALELSLEVEVCFCICMYVCIYECLCEIYICRHIYIKM